MILASWTLVTCRYLNFALKMSSLSLTYKKVNWEQAAAQQIPVNVFFFISPVTYVTDSNICPQSLKPC